MKQMGAFVQESAHFQPVPPAWEELHQALRSKLVLQLCTDNDRVERLPLLDDLLLFHVQATRLQRGGRIHKHKDKVLFGEFICMVLLRGVSTVRLWDSDSTRFKWSSSWPQARPTACGVPHAQTGSMELSTTTVKARLSLTFRFLPRSAVNLLHFGTRPRPARGVPGARRIAHGDDSHLPLFFHFRPAMVGAIGAVSAIKRRRRGGAPHSSWAKDSEDQEEEDALALAMLSTVESVAKLIRDRGLVYKEICRLGRCCGMS